MREFSSGILGCIICILALMGSVLGGFCLGAESETREVTNYDYKTDLTGVFATDNAPEYIEYNPADNFMGYSRNTIDYQKSSIANAYRYIVSYPNDTTIDSVTIRNTDFLAPSDDFLITSANTQLVMNVTNGNYNYGTVKTSDGISYNVFCNTTSIYGLPNIPKVTNLYAILNSYRGHSDTITIDITNTGDHPLLMTTSSLSTKTLRDNPNAAWSINYTSIANHPTQIVWDTVSDNVTVYNGSTVLFTNQLNQTLVYYTYQYNAGGTPVQANINAKLTLNLNNVVIDAVNEDDNYQMVVNYSPIFYNSSPNHGYPDTATASYGTRPYNLRANADGMTSLSNMISANNIDADVFEIQLQDFSSWADVIFMKITDFVLLPGQGGTGAPPMRYAILTDANYPSKIAYNNGQCTVYYNNDSNSWTDSASNILVVYAARQYNGTPYDVLTNMIYVWDVQEEITVTSNMNIDNSNIFSSSDTGTSVLIDWNGTIELGTERTYAGIQYDLSVPRVDNKASVSTLYRMLEKMGIEYFSSIDLTITYGSSPVLIYGGDFVRNDLNIGNSTQYIYTATLNENNSMPDRIVVMDGTAQLFKNSTLIGTKPINQVYVINKYMTSYTTNMQNTIITMNGFATTDRIPANIVIDNDSDFTKDGYDFGTLPENTYNHNYSRQVLMRYTGSEYNNLGKERFSTEIGETYTTIINRTLSGDGYPADTKLLNVLDIIGTTAYPSIDLTITYGTHPVMFVRGDWEYSVSEERISEGDHGTGVTFTTYTYFMEFGDEAFPDRITYTKATNMVHAYKDGVQIWKDLPQNVQVLWKYRIVNNDNTISAPITDQRATMIGFAMLNPTYAYADPTKGITLKTPFTEWSNGYENNEIDITFTKNWKNPNIPEDNDLTISVGTSSITIERLASGGLYITVNKYDGTTETRNIGNWFSGQVTFNASEGWVAITPIAGSRTPNFTNPVELNETTIVWKNWYDTSLGTIKNMKFSTTGTSLRWSVTNTTVFLETYGIVMFNPSVDVTEYFPDMENWRLNFFSFSLIGDSITVNDRTFPVDTATQIVTVTDKDGDEIKGELTNIYITQENGRTYFSFANSKKTVDLGETTTNTVSFSGMWYFTTGLFDVVKGTEKFYDWNLTGQLHATMPQMCLIFLGILIAGLVICKKILGMEVGILDWIILISASLISLIIAGGTI